MQFRKAQQDEIETVFFLYQSVLGMPHCVWDEEYPGQADAELDYQTGNLYVLAEGNTILGAISILPENELEELPFWQVSHAREFARVVVSPAHQGKGLAQKMVTDVCDVLKRNGCPAVHLLAAADNPPAQKVYKNCGFIHRGECHMFGHRFLGFEKIL